MLRSGLLSRLERLRSTAAIGLRSLGFGLLGVGALGSGLLGSGLLGSCAGDVSSVEASTETGGTPRTSESSGGAIAALAQIEDAADSVAFHGVIHNRFERGPHVLENREEIWSDGQGLLAFELVDAISLTPEYDTFSYPIAYEAAALFHWHFRRFRVRGAERVTSNYSVTLTSETPTVAGMPCERLRIHRTESIGDRPGSYEVDFHPDTGLVLAWREFDATGHAFRTSEFESLDLSPDFSSVTLRGPRFAAVELSFDNQLAGQAGFTVRVPEVPPSGFEFVTAQVVHVPSSVLGPGAQSFLPTGDYARLLATDGIETIVFMHTASSVSPPVGGGGAPGGLGSVIKRLSQGAWEIGFGQRGGTGFIASGRVSDDELYRFIQSAF